MGVEEVICDSLIVCIMTAVELEGGRTRQYTPSIADLFWFCLCLQSLQHSFGKECFAGRRYYTFLATG